jgi:hypothetical protein
MMPERIRDPEGFRPTPEDLEDLEQIAKRCPACGANWTGWMWKERFIGVPPKFDENGTHVTLCHRCLDQQEAEDKRRTESKEQAPPPDVELTPPNRTLEDNYEL